MAGLVFFVASIEEAEICGPVQLVLMLVVVVPTTQRGRHPSTRRTAMTTWTAFSGAVASLASHVRRTLHSGGVTGIIRS